MSADRELLHLLSHGPNLQHTGARWTGGLVAQWPGDSESVCTKGSVVVRNPRGPYIVLFFWECGTWSSVYILSTLTYWQLTKTITKGQAGHTEQGMELPLVL